MRGLSDLGVSYDDVVATLEEEGVDKFEKSWAELVEGVESELGRARS
jgi:transaldolase